MASILSDDGATVVAGAEQKHKSMRLRCTQCGRKQKPARMICKCGKAYGSRVRGVSKARVRKMIKKHKKAGKAAKKHIGADTLKAFQAYPAFNHAAWLRDHGMNGDQ